MTATQFISIAFSLVHVWWTKESSCGVVPQAEEWEWVVAQPEGLVKKQGVEWAAALAGQGQAESVEQALARQGQAGSVEQA